MASSHSPSSKSTSRRLPPPCWSDDETVALIDVYRDKWYSLRRGNLRAPDWQEVADGVAARCLINPPKTSIQCRHKMEKLRKRYRSEIQRVGSNPKGNRHQSAWIHFKLMESMELGLSSSDLSVNPSNQDDEEADEEEDDLICNPNPNRGYPRSIATDSVRIKIPNFANRLVDDLPPSLNSQHGSGQGLRNGLKRRNDDCNNVMNEMVAAIQKLGDGFVRMEKMKMDMARELESMRMKTEMEQTEMILETHQKLWDSFSESYLEKKKKKKKMKRMPPTPEEA